MRVALAISALMSSTGGERQLLELASRLRQSGHTVTIFTAFLDESKCFPALLTSLRDAIVLTHPSRLWRVLAHRARLHTNSNEPLYLFFMLLPFVRAIRKSRPEVINIHGIGPHWLAPLFRITCPRARLVWMANDIPFWYYKPELRNPERISRMVEWVFYRVVDRLAVMVLNTVIVLDKRNRALADRVYHRNTQLLRSGVDVKFFQANAPENEFLGGLGISETDLIILQVGTAAPYKCSDDHLYAFQQLYGAYPRSKLVLVGYFSKSRYAPIAKELGIESRVLLLENLRDAHIRALYQRSDIYIFCMDQTWGLAPIEAMACGKPVIVSSRTGVAEVIHEGENGFVYGFGNPSNLAKKIEALLTNQEMRKKIGQTARAFVEANFSWERYTAEMLNLFAAQQ